MTPVIVYGIHSHGKQNHNSICVCTTTWVSNSPSSLPTSFILLGHEDERSVGQPRALYPETGVCEQLCQMVRLYAPGPLPVPPGPPALQGPGVCPTQEVQGPGTCLTDQQTDRGIQCGVLVWWLNVDRQTDPGGLI